MKCNVCGTVFPAIRERHYISRDNSKTGLAAALSSTDETALFDTYDCPNCGCQVVAQPRKRNYEPSVSDEELLDAIGDEVISDHLGLTEKQMNTIRQAKEDGGKIGVVRVG